jgi:predicted dehydrogenase
MILNRRSFLSTTAAAGLAGSCRAFAAEPRLRVAVIGHTGRGNYGHGIDTLWLEVPETEIVAVADPDERGLASAVERLKAGKSFADYRRMLDEIKPDLVAIGPRHVDQHRDMVVAAAAAGAKGVYIEKPLCRTLAEADDMVAACARSNTKVAVAHRNRYHPVLPVITKLLADGAIGRLLEVRARGKEDQRGGSLDLWVLGSHLLNLMHYFGGRPLACSAVVLQGGKAVTKADVREGDEGVGPLAGNEVHARFEMERGQPAFFDSVQGAGNSAAGFGIQLIGTGGIIDLRADREPNAYLLAGSPFVPVTDPRAWTVITSGGVGVPEPIADIRAQVGGHLAPARDLIASIREDRAPLCSLEDGRVTMEMIMGIFESHRQGGASVALPLETRENPLGLL